MRPLSSGCGSDDDDRLVAINEKGEFVPMLAQELPLLDNGGLSKDYLTVTWKLKPDLKWSDGEPITSDDIKFTWEVLSNPNSGALAGTDGFDLITNVETPDDLTAVMTYSSLIPDISISLPLGCFRATRRALPMICQTGNGTANLSARDRLFLSDWVSGESLTMERNPNYFEPGKPHLDKLVFRIVPEPAAQTAMMMNGEAQFHLWPGEFKVDYDKLLEGKAKQYLIPGIWNMAIDFNLSAPFDGDQVHAAASDLG